MEERNDVEMEDVGSHEPVELRFTLALDTRSCTRLPCATWLGAVTSSHSSDAVCPPSDSGSERSVSLNIQTAGTQNRRFGVYEVCISFATHLRWSVKVPISVYPEIWPPPLESVQKSISRYRVDLSTLIPVARTPRSRLHLTLLL